MRITGGSHRSRPLVSPTDRAIRPTTDRVREAVFGILAHHWDQDRVEGARVLDAFCGTGALALEALSRGAAAAVLMDRDPRSLDLARNNAAALGETARCRFIRADATRPAGSSESFTLVFLDPPYGQGLAATAALALAQAGWLAPDALIVVEQAAASPESPPPGFMVPDQRRYGDTLVAFWTSGR
ncbi:MAG: 16S rRNA (guanine(966)-N(2))-methyltransferase RsmD [Azospirillaceae bacterium]|nr:16S rRNA (guanine(966)-N(2))-methyltransferase RsmD [Azospirillaceae bacterium]